MGAPQVSFLMQISVVEKYVPRVCCVIPGSAGAAAVRSTARSVRIDAMKIPPDFVQFAGFARKIFVGFLKNIYCISALPVL